MRIVITGAAGFIGSVLSLRASERGHEVLALDDLSRGLNNVNALGANTIFARHDCQGGIQEAVGGKTDWSGRKGNVMDIFDAVVHLAAGTGSLDRPYEELVALNVGMTQRVFADAQVLGAKVFVFPTTSLALGVPDSPYVRSKEDAMRWVLAQRLEPRYVDGKKVGPEVLPLRFFNVLGAYKGFSEKRKKEVHIVPRLVECYYTGEEFTINGNDYETADGTPSRDFVNVLDVADYILANLEHFYALRRFHPSTVFQADGAAWVGTGWATTALEVATIFGQWVGRVNIKSGPRRAFDCGALHCHTTAPSAVRSVIARPLAPAWIGIRDEAVELLLKYNR